MASSLPSTISSSARKSALLPDRRASISPSRGRPGNRQPGEGDQAALVIFDLNSGKTDPIDAIAALKADPSWRGFARSVCLPHASELMAAATASGGRSGAAALGVRPILAEILLSAGRVAPLITRSDIVAASARIAPYMVRTPLRRSEWLSGRRGRRLVKLVVAQVKFCPGGAIRGALNAVLRLIE